MSGVSAVVLCPYPIPSIQYGWEKHYQVNEQQVLSCPGSLKLHVIEICNDLHPSGDQLASSTQKGILSLRDLGSWKDKLLNGH